MKKFFYRYWGLYYFLFFLLLGLLVYALLWHPIPCGNNITINELNDQLEECRNGRLTVDTTLDKNRKDVKPDNKIDCDASVKSGGQGITNTQHELGERSGTVVIEYDMQQVPDEITAYYNDTVVAQSNGLVRGAGRLEFIYYAVAGKPTFCTVTVSAPNNDTRWDYLLNCPQ